LGDENLLILSREIHRQGRNTCRINGRIVNLSIYREIASSLVDMHGQHDQLSLLSPAKQLQLLDSYGGNELPGLVKQTEQLYRQWLELINKERQIISGARERQQRIDMLEFQIREIDQAALEEVDYEELLRRRNKLANAERIGILAESVLRLIYNGIDHHSPAAIDLLGQARNELEEFSRYLPESKNCLENINSAIFLVEDAAREIASYRESIEVNPEELNYVEQRLSLIEKLKRKYADTVPGILDYRRSIGKELDELLALERDGIDISGMVEEYKKKYYESASKTSKLRQEVASNLQLVMERELKELGMPLVKFAIEIVNCEPSPRGTDSVQFMFSPNPGEPLKPLAKTASGGELSRVLLALRSVLATTDDIATIVFDEVDAGIGGKTIHAVADKLEQLSEQRQVICITHAAAVAAIAATHYRVIKKTEKDKTFTSLVRLDGEDRVKELSRMVGGDENSELLTSYARKMLKGS